MLKQTLIKQKNIIIAIAVIIILIIGAYERLWKISEYMTFLGDEGRDVLIVKQMIVDHKFTLLGPTASVGGFFLGPIYYYFMIPFLWAWQLDPTGPAVMVALFGIVTVYLVYRLGSELFNHTTGIFAASLYAVSPFVIAHSRSSWNPNVVPFFSVLLLYLLWRVVVRARWHELFWVGVVLGIGLQLHYLFLFLFVVAGIWLLTAGRKIGSLRAYVLAILGLMVGLSPYLAFEIRHGFVNTQTVIRFIGEGKDTGFVLYQFYNSLLDIPYRLFGRLLFRLPQPEVMQKFAPWIASLYGGGVRTVVLIGVTLLAFFTIRGRPKRQQLASMMLLIWLLIPVLLFGFYKKAIYDYYFGIFFAVPFLVTGFILAYLAKRRWGAAVAGMLWVALLVYNWQGRPFRYPPNNLLANTRHVAQVAFDATGGMPFNFALITDNNSDHAYRYFFEVWGRPPVVIENETADPQRRTVTNQLIVICENTSCRPLGHPLWEIAGFGRAEITGSWDVPFVKIFRLVHYEPTLTEDE